MTALSLAQRIKRDPQTISRWERGLSVPDANDLERIAAAFECSVGALFEPPAAPLFPDEPTDGPVGSPKKLERTRVDHFEHVPTTMRSYLSK